MSESEVSGQPATGEPTKTDVPSDEERIKGLIFEALEEGRAGLRLLVEVRAAELEVHRRIAVALERYAGAGERIATAAEKRK